MSEGPVIRGDFATTYAPAPRADAAYAAVVCSPPASVDGVMLSSQDSMMVMAIVVCIAAVSWVSGFTYGARDD